MKKIRATLEVTIYTSDVDFVIAVDHSSVSAIPVGTLLESHTYLGWLDEAVNYLQRRLKEYQQQDTEMAEEGGLNLRLNFGEVCELVWMQIYQAPHDCVLDAVRDPAKYGIPAPRLDTLPKEIQVYLQRRS